MRIRYGKSHRIEALKRIREILVKQKDFDQGDLLEAICIIDKALVPKPTPKSAGEKNGQATLTEKQVVRARKIFPILKSYRKVADEVGGSYHAVYAALTNNSWNYLNKTTYVQAKRRKRVA